MINISVNYDIDIISITIISIFINAVNPQITSIDKIIHYIISMIIKKFFIIVIIRDIIYSRATDHRPIN